MKNKMAFRTFSTDAIMRTTWLHLLQDFRKTLGSQYATGAEQALNDGISSFRQYNWPSRMETSPQFFKRDVQLETLFKRYQFANDLYTQDDLEQITNSKFVATQRRVGMPIQLSMYTKKAIQKARFIISDILGDYDEEKHRSLCQFGKRASVGCPASESYLCNKLANSIITGSCDHIKWFSKQLESDTLLDSILPKCSTTMLPWYRECDCLKLANVAKSYKALRSVMPNTLCGSFHSYGLGKYVQQCLASAGLDISVLQDVHKHLACRYSKSRTHVTADLSAASDSFGADVVNMLLPRKWYNAFKYGRVSKVSIDGQVIKMTSFMTMGVGFTFPLQTLLFYGLLKAIESLTHVEGRISVYGDDLIYPTPMHRYVIGVFSQLRLVLNHDKTFCTSFFRESCGGDFFHGIDVRPFQPEGTGRAVRKLEILGLLYKIYNGLSLRWSPEEIAGTLLFIKRNIASIGGHLHQVPFSFPDYTGIKTDRLEEVWYEPWTPVKFNRRDQTYSVPYLGLDSEKYFVFFETPYLWSWFTSKVNHDVYSPWEEVTPTLEFSIATKQPRNYRSKIDGRRLKKLSPHVARKNSNRFSMKRAIVPSFAYKAGSDKVFPPLWLRPYLCEPGLFTVPIARGL